MSLCGYRTQTHTHNDTVFGTSNDRNDDDDDVVALITALYRLYANAGGASAARSDSVTNPHSPSLFAHTHRFSAAPVPQAEARPHRLLAVTAAEAGARVRVQPVRGGSGTQGAGPDAQPLRDSGMRILDS